MDTVQEDGHVSAGFVESLSSVANAAMDRTRITGWTHNFYRYPARFSPQFAAAAVRSFSKPGDLVLDPYMGGGTVIVEGILAGRSMVGNDLNSLAAFVTRVKTTPLAATDVGTLRRWAKKEVPTFNFRRSAFELDEFVDQEKTLNLTLLKARFIKKAIAAALASIDRLPTEASRNFARCIVLRVSQWALDGRRRHTTVAEFRHKLTVTACEMIEANRNFTKEAARSGGSALLLNRDTATLTALPFFAQNKATLVVTSPPYPGVHVLYHRWQVDGRRETPAPYWIAGCSDGRGSSFYNFGDRRLAALAEDYFRKSLMTLRAIRNVVRDGAIVLQLLAFHSPEEHLPRYLANMKEAGFAEISFTTNGRTWRDVPSRKWYTSLTGETESSREVLLVHRAV